MMAERANIKSNKEKRMSEQKSMQDNKYKIHIVKSSEMLECKIMPMWKTNRCN